MSHAPPVPEGNQSPYPIQEPPHPHRDDRSPAAKDATPAADRLRDLPLLVAGTAIGLGAALIGGAVFGWLRIKPKLRGKQKGR